MTDIVPNTLVLAGRVVGFTPPTQGQLEAMIRIGRTLKSGTDDDNSEFWQIQIHRIGKLLFAMIAEGDRDTVEDLYLEGKVDHQAVLSAILAKMNADAVDSEDKAIAKAKTKASPVRVQRK